MIFQDVTKKARKESLKLYPNVLKEGNDIIIEGSDWCNCPISIKIDNDTVKYIRIAQGLPVEGGLVPYPTGSFVVLVSTLGIKPGKHSLIATSIQQGDKQSSSKQFEVQKRELFKSDGTPADKPYQRSLAFFERRYGQLGFVPPGIRDIQMNELQMLRKVDQTLFSMPITGVCNWQPIGAGPLPNATDNGTYPAISGRVTAIAIDPLISTTIFIGTAGGGVWKSIDDGFTWSPKTDYQTSLAIGAIAIDPFNTSRLFAGTGVDDNLNGQVIFSNGNGILRSEDGGAKWTELASSIFERSSISRIIFDVTDTTSKRIFLSSTLGVYESIDNGVNWTILSPGKAIDLVMIVESTGKSKVIRLIAAFYASGLWTATRTIDKGKYKWSTWTQYTGTAFPSSFNRIVLGQSKNNPKTIYAMFEIDGRPERLVKTNDGGKKWTSIPVRFNDTPAAADRPAESSSVLEHSHNMFIPISDMTALPSAHTYKTNSSGTPTHTHNISFTSVEIERLASGRTVSKNTDADSSGHQHTFELGMWLGQGGYNFHIAVHPNDTNIVYFGEIRLWKTTTGGGVFKDITFGPLTTPEAGTPYAIHVDQHCFAFDPKDPNIIWAGNDGGIYRSVDSGKKWAQRNRDLGTFQYVTVSSHPQWETIMLGGTQDNGLHRYSGSPAWEFSRGGDAGFTAIDSTMPTRMYQGYVENWILRSDEAGAKGSWGVKTGAVTGDVMFYPPFVLDPSDQQICYFGNSRLWRSPEYAVEWFAITKILNGLITAIAVHPEDSTRIYIGTNLGNIYRVLKTGITWDLKNVTTTDLTKPPLPPGGFISDIAVDTDGNVWLTISSVLRDTAGKFINNYVYCLLNTGHYTWESRSNGLANANPIHSIVIDPLNKDRLFCAGDLGVFRTEDAGLKWRVWDQGLPNVVVTDLVIQGPRRLLRAATYGRSIWERPIESGFCPPVDLYIRDSILDSGRVQPSPSDHPHPFTPSTKVYWWQSPDIKVDAKEPGYQTPEPITDFVAYESHFNHRTAKRNSENRFYVQVHNRGPKKATNVQVRAFFARASAGLPKLPADFWSGGSPFKKDPSATDWKPIGPTKIISELEPAEPGIVEWNWIVPDTAPKHSCLMALITCEEDPLKATDIYDIGILVPTSDHITLKNLHVDNPVLGTSSADSAYLLELHDSETHGRLVDLVFNWGSLPKETKVFVVFETLSNNDHAVKVDPEDLKQLGIIAFQNTNDKNLFYPELEYGCRETKYFDLKYIYRLHLMENKTTTIIPSVSIPQDRPLLMAINLVLPKYMEQKSVQFDILQRAGQRITGGSTYLLFPRKK